MEEIIPSIPFILEGILITLKFVLLSGVIGFILGIGVALAKLGKSKALGKIAGAYTAFFRGTPLILQLVYIYYVIPQVTPWNIEPFVAGVIAFSLNSAAYISEIIRAGIQSVDKGQFEAAKALNIPYFKAMRKIILPQAIKHILPALMNEGIMLLKESAVISVIGVSDIMRRGQIVAADTYNYIGALTIPLILYFLMVRVLEMYGSRVERRLSYSD
ncbi:MULTISPECIES: amino acid ABC transporter permease [Pontibacillus]|uniref:Arginine ABC transporter permease n=1 Tax=Pontibacillus salipaludis TaxID=1697394 RepID=A0ABQ1PYN2_9BACI|nr:MULTISPECIES: amino acid ABC transporter permease [Pontibacillus]QSS99491.1 amino acid ABC transporter permease [Pontibacillus sp. ALD_SL1]GGD07142.1 arginine ABC transporter permease [Pontibacillus salipaludis]